MFVGKAITQGVLDDIRSKSPRFQEQYLGLPDFPDPPQEDTGLVDNPVAPVGAVERSSLPEIEGENFPEAQFRSAPGTTVRSNPHDGIPISQPQSTPSLSAQPTSVVSSYAPAEPVKPAGAVEAIDSRFGRPVEAIPLGSGQIGPMYAEDVNPFSAIARNKPNKVNPTTASVTGQIDPFATATTLQDSVPTNDVTQQAQQHP